MYALRFIMQVKYYEEMYCLYRGLGCGFQKMPIFRGTVFLEYGFLGVVLRVQLLRLVGGQKP